MAGSRGYNSSSRRYPELKKEVKTCAAVVRKNFVQQLEERISCWSKMKRVVALVLCYKKKLQERIKKKQQIEENGESSNTDNLCSLEELKAAEEEII